MINTRVMKVLLADGHARQALALASAFYALQCSVTAICESRLDVCACSKYVDHIIKDTSIQDSPENRIECVLKEIAKGGYTLVVACTDTTAEQMAIHKAQIETYAKTSVVEKKLFYRAFDKLETMRFCMENDIPCPKTYFGIKGPDDSKLHNIAFPIVLKPRQGYGAIGFHRIETMDKLKDYIAEHMDQIEHMIIQEYIPQTDIQYEAAVFVDQNNAIKSAMVFEKNRWFPVDGGSSTLNTSVKDPDIVANCSRLLQGINWRGCADIDLIRDPRDGVAKVMEINPRMSGSAKIVLLSGVNLALQLLEMAVGEEVTDYFEYKTGVKLRCLYTDFLWFLKSKNRFRVKPSWFDFHNTCEQVFSWDDPKPFFAFSVKSLLKLKIELKKREH